MGGGEEGGEKERNKKIPPAKNEKWEEDKEVIWIDLEDENKSKK